MHLTENESRLQDYLDGRLSAPDSVAVESHLAACPECQAFFEQWQALDLELSQALSKPVLSPDFHDRVLDRIKSHPAPGISEADAKLRLEDQAGWENLRKNFIRTHVPAFLDCLGYSTAAAVAAYLLFHLTLNLLNTQLKSLNLSSSQLTLGVAVTAACVFLLVAFGVAARKQLLGFLQELSA